MCVQCVCFYAEVKGIMTKCQGHKGHKLSLATYFNIKELGILVKAKRQIKTVLASVLFGD